MRLQEEECFCNDYIEAQSMLGIVFESNLNIFSGPCDRVVVFESYSFRQRRKPTVRCQSCCKRLPFKERERCLISSLYSSGPMELHLFFSPHRTDCRCYFLCDWQYWELLHNTAWVPYLDDLISGPRDTIARLSVFRVLRGVPLLGFGRYDRWNKVEIIGCPVQKILLVLVLFS